MNSTSPAALTPRPARVGIVGLYCSTFSPNGEWLHWTGRVIGCPQAGYYLVEIFARGTAIVTHIRLVHHTDMVWWHFYRTEEAMDAECAAFPSLIPAPLPGKDQEQEKEKEKEQDMERPFGWRVIVSYIRNSEERRTIAVMHVIANNEEEARDRVYERREPDCITDMVIVSMKKLDPGAPTSKKAYWHVKVREHRNRPFETSSHSESGYSVVAENAGEAAKKAEARSRANHPKAYVRAILSVASVAEEPQKRSMMPYEVQDWNVTITLRYGSTLSYDSTVCRVVASTRDAAAKEALRCAADRHFAHSPTSSAVLEVDKIEAVPDTERPLVFTPIK